MPIPQAPQPAVTASVVDKQKEPVVNKVVREQTNSIEEMRRNLLKNSLQLLHPLQNIATLGLQIVTGTAKKQVKEKSSVSNHNGGKSKSSSKVRASEPQVKQTKALEPRDEEEELVSSSSFLLG
ncbi:hypothetical protein KIW84_046307 [Lathyrus oleraceus]|uniref:Uncharacterized protein n=1 Tax=Pisum sativum TaxID=3888 RepID=A0A9D4XMM8_PEA|nr:hypothetical protein KIW84_046305 [Pisum sativum]KAI5423257.1 hypothetical protein KIW84_046307 [Pisum sativum]